MGLEWGHNHYAAVSQLECKGNGLTGLKLGRSVPERTLWLMCPKSAPKIESGCGSVLSVRGKNRYTTTRIRCSRSSPRRVAEENTNNNNNNSSKKKKKDIPSGRIKCPIVYFLLADPVISWTVLSDFGLVVQFQLNGYKKQEARIRSTEVPH